MVAIDLPALRGVSELAARPELELGPFAEVTALSRRYETVVLHRDGCHHAEQRVGFTAAAPVAPADLRALEQVAARLPDAKEVPLLGVDWCHACAPYNRPSSEAEHRSRGAWLSLAMLVAELAIIDEQLDPLLAAAGPDRTWPAASRLRHRAVLAHRAHARALMFAVEAHRAHPCVGELTIDLGFGVDLVGTYQASMAEQGDVDAATLNTALTWVRDRVSAQRSALDALLRSFPLDRLARPVQPAKPDVLVLTRAQALGQGTGARMASAVTVEALAWPLVVHDDLVVLRVPDTVLDDLAVPPLGLARVPAGDVTQVAAVAVASAHQQTARLRYDRDLFADLVRGAADALT